MIAPIARRVVGGLALAGVCVGLTAAAAARPTRRPPTPRKLPPATHLWYRVTAVIEGTVRRSAPEVVAGNTLTETWSSKWMGESRHAVILTVGHGRYAAFGALVDGRLTDATYHRTQTSTVGSTVCNIEENETLNGYQPLLAGVSQDDGPDPILRVAVNPLGFENILIGAADETCNDGFTDHVPSLGCTRLYGCLPVSTDGNNLSSWVGLADPDYFGRTLALRVPSGAFGGSFSVERTQGYYDPRLFTDLKLSVTLNFDACPRHGHDVQGC